MLYFGKQRIIKCCAIISQNVVNREYNRVHNHRSAWNNASKYGHEAYRRNHSNIENARKCIEFFFLTIIAAFLVFLLKMIKNEKRQNFRKVLGILGTVVKNSIKKGFCYKSYGIKIIVLTNFFQW